MMWTFVAPAGLLPQGDHVSKMHNINDSTEGCCQKSLTDAQVLQSTCGTAPVRRRAEVEEFPRRRSARREGPEGA